VEIREKSVRGTISNRLSAGKLDPAKLDAKIQSPNLQTVDVAALPATADTLRLSFTVKILPGAGTPSACNRSDYREKLLEKVGSYTSKHGFSELALRYAYNLANARFLWRNRMAAEQIAVVVRRLINGKEEQRWDFNAHDFNLRKFEATETGNFSDLAKLIEAGMSGKQFVLLEVVAYAQMGEGQEVYPSQELILEKGSKSKTLYNVGDVAAMHSQKVGNALRTIDTWYDTAASEDIGPISVEPYGSVTSQGRAYRQPQDKKDFYTLLDNWIIRDQEPELDQQHFVIATLIRGGVFGAAEK